MRPYNTSAWLFSNGRALCSASDVDRHFLKLYRSTPPTVDRRKPANQLRLVVYPVIYHVLYIPSGCLGFLPSRVSSAFLDIRVIRGPQVNVYFFTNH